MPGRVQSVGRSPNAVGLSSIGLSGFEFEDRVFGVLAAALSDERDHVRLWQTPRTGDGGKDIIVESKIPIDILGLRAVPKREDGMRVYVECKATESGRLRLEAFAKNFLQTREESFDYFVLATNGAITPHAFHVTFEAFRDNGVTFLVADECFVREALSKGPGALPANLPAPAHDPVVVEYQYERHPYNGGALVDVYLWFRNYSDDVRACRLFLRSDRNWATREADTTLYLDPRSGRSVLLRAVREFYDGRDDLELGLELDGTDATLAVPASSISLDFVPRLFGAQHHGIVRDLVHVLDRNDPFAVVSITGEAGTGKSRVIDELIERRAAGNVKFFRVHFERGDPHRAVRRLLDLLDRELDTDFVKQLASETPGQALQRLIQELQSAFYAVVLVLEDVHHADSGIIQALKGAARSDRRETSPLCLVLTGRNDFTFPNEHYFSLLELLALESDDPNNEK